MVADPPSSPNELELSPRLEVNWAERGPPGLHPMARRRIHHTHRLFFYDWNLTFLEVVGALCIDAQGLVIDAFAVSVENLVPDPSERFVSGLGDLVGSCCREFHLDATVLGGVFLCCLQQCPTYS